MQLHFANPSLAYSVDSILLFHTGEQTELWQGALFHCFPQVSREQMAGLPPQQRRDYLLETLAPAYADMEAELDQKLAAYTAHWQQHRQQVTDAFSHAFGGDIASRLGPMGANITLNPICPRFLDTQRFDVFYLNSARGALGIAIHEMIHFAWFKVWQAHFSDDPARYEIPHIQWIFSEMAVDAIIRRDTRLSAINPYFPDDHVYPCFFSMRLGDERALDALYAAYCRLPMIDFMEWGLAYCLRHEPAIRAQMTDFL